jgi:hypothetical protein
MEYDHRRQQEVEMTSVNPLLDAIGAVVMAIAVLTSLVAVWSLLPRPHRLIRPYRLRRRA